MSIWVDAAVVRVALICLGYAMKRLRLGFQTTQVQKCNVGTCHSCSTKWENLVLEADLSGLVGRRAEYPHEYRYVELSAFGN